MTTSRKLMKEEWASYFDRVSKDLVGKRVKIEVASLALGDQVEARWLPLFGVAYDPKGDVLEIALQNVDHLIRHPRELHVVEGPHGLESMEVIDGDDNRQIMRLKG